MVKKSATKATPEAKQPRLLSQVLKSEYASPPSSRSWFEKLRRTDPEKAKEVYELIEDFANNGPTRRQLIYPFRLARCIIDVAGIDVEQQAVVSFIKRVENGRIKFEG